MSKLYIQLSAKVSEYTPPALNDGGKKLPVFVLREPTPDETTRLGQEMFRRGLAPISQASVRATLIDDLYNHFPEDVADEKAAILEEWWHFDEIHQADTDIWQEQEKQRLEDIAQGGPQREQEPLPRFTGSPRIRAKGQLIVDEMSVLSSRMIEIGLRQANYDKTQRRMTSRLYIRDWRGLKSKPQFDDDDKEALTEESLSAVFEEIGPIAQRELEERISRSFALSEDERKNLDSLAESEQKATGLPTRKDVSGNSDGKWTGSDTGPTPDAVSGRTTEE